MKNGFSLIQMIVGLAMLSGVSLMVMKSTSSQYDVMDVIESKRVELETFNQIRYILSNKQACNSTIQGENISAGLTQLKFINNGSGPYINIGDEFGENKSFVKLTALELSESAIDPTGGQGTVKIDITLERIQDSNNIIFQKEVLIAVETDVFGNITDCLSDEDLISGLAKKEMCELIGGSFDSVSENCDLSCPVSLNGDLSLITAECLVKDFENDYVKQNNPEPVNGNIELMGNSKLEANSMEIKDEICVGNNCHDFKSSDCKPGQIVTGVDGSGRFICSGNKCKDDQYFNGYDFVKGKLKIRCVDYTAPPACNKGEYVDLIHPDGSVVCKPIPPTPSKDCNKGEYLAGVTKEGKAVCQKDIGIGTDSCKSGEYVSHLNGDGTFECKYFADKNVYNRSCPKGKLATGFNKFGKINCADKPTGKPAPPKVKWNYIGQYYSSSKSDYMFSKHIIKEGAWGHKSHSIAQYRDFKFAEKSFKNSVPIWRCLALKHESHYAGRNGNCGGGSKELFLGYLSTKYTTETPVRIVQCYKMNFDTWYSNTNCLIHGGSVVTTLGYGAK